MPLLLLAAAGAQSHWVAPSVDQALLVDWPILVGWPSFVDWVLLAGRASSVVASIVPEHFCFAVAGCMSLPERAVLGAADCWFAVNSFERFDRTVVRPSVEWLAVVMLSAEPLAAEKPDIHLAYRQLEIVAGPR